MLLSDVLWSTLDKSIVVVRGKAVNLLGLLWHGLLTVPRFRITTYRLSSPTKVGRSGDRPTTQCKFAPRTLRNVRRANNDDTRSGEEQIFCVRISAWM